MSSPTGTRREPCPGSTVMRRHQANRGECGARANFMGPFMHCSMIGRERGVSAAEIVVWGAVKRRARPGQGERRDGWTLQAPWLQISKASSLPIQRWRISSP